MPVTKSAKKTLRKEKRKTLVNQRIRQNLKKILKQTKKNPTPRLFRQATSVLDRAAKKGVICPNRAARLKSRLARLLKKKKSSISK